MKVLEGHMKMKTKLKSQIYIKAIKGAEGLLDDNFSSGNAEAIENCCISKVRCKEHSNSECFRAAKIVSKTSNPGNSLLDCLRHRITDSLYIPSGKFSVEEGLKS